MNGDGKTDFVAVRGTGSSLTGLTGDNGSPGFINLRSVRDRMRFQREQRSSQLSPSVVQAYWWTLINGTPTVNLAAWGDAVTDTVTPEDFDGDGTDDIAIWRNGAPGTAGFWIFQSGTSTSVFVPFGQLDDDASVVADYDGDGKADPATFRCPLGPTPGQCTFFYKGSLNNPGGTITSFPLGVGTIFTVLPYRGDFDGDKKDDFCVFQEDPGIPGQGQFNLVKSGGGTELIDWGLMTDTIVPGDFDGDHKSDFMVVRETANGDLHYLLTRTNVVSVTNWGITGDVPVPGDYDGDGITDIAIWRPRADPTPGTYWVIKSSNHTTFGVDWGTCLSICDTPAANWNVH
jgi:hypothetical protein